MAENASQIQDNPMGAILVSALRLGYDGKMRRLPVHPGFVLALILAALLAACEKPNGFMLQEPNDFTLQGTVVHSTPERREAPVSGASIELTRYDIDQEGSISVVTDSQGRFRLEQMPRGYYWLELAHDVLRHNETVEVASGEELRIELRTVWISGWVRNAADGRPVEGVHLVFERAALNHRTHRGFRSSAMMSDSAGRFQVRPVPEGTWRVRTYKQGYGSVGATVDVSVAAPVDGLLFEIAPTDGLSLQIGKGALDNGELPPFVELLFLDPSSGHRVTYENVSPLPADGLLRVTTVPDGTWLLRLTAMTYVAPDITLTSPGHAGPIVLRRAGRIHLRIRDLIEVPDDEDPGHASLKLTGPDGQPYLPDPLFLMAEMELPPGAWPIVGGETMIHSLSPGLWSFTVTHGDGRTWSGQANVIAGETAQASVP